VKQEKFLDTPRSPHFSVSKWRESSLFNVIIKMDLVYQDINMIDIK
jgi:hypothetical protein